MIQSEITTFEEYISTAKDMEEIANIIVNFVKSFGPISKIQRRLVDNKLIELEYLDA